MQVKREEIFQIAAKYGAYNIRIFGSVARKEADANSDVDFLVEMEPGRSLFDLGGLLMDLQELLDCDVDVVTEKGLRLTALAVKRSLSHSGTGVKRGSFIMRDDRIEAT